MEKEMNYLTPKMVSDILHIGISKTYRLFKIKGFPSVKISNQWLVESEDLKKFMSEYRGSGLSL